MNSPIYHRIAQLNEIIAECDSTTEVLKRLLADAHDSKARAWNERNKLKAMMYPHL